MKTSANQKHSRKTEDAHKRRLQRLVRRLRDLANQIDQMCAAAEKDSAFEHAGIGGTYLVDASNDVHCAIAALSPNK